MSDGGFCHYCKRTPNQCECPDPVIDRLTAIEQREQQATKPATCDTHGHIYDQACCCLFCGAPKPETGQAECLPYLKDGETPAQCIARNRHELTLALGLLAKATTRAEQVEAQYEASLSRTRQLREALETLNVAVKGYRAMVCGECGGSIEECVDGERLDSAVRAARAALEQDQ